MQQRTPHTAIRLPGLHLLATLFLAVALVLPVHGAAAQEQNGQQPLPIQFTSDELDVDQELGIITARGNVEINHDGRTLMADSVSFNQRTDVVTASGDIVLQEPSGDVVFGDHMTLSGDLKDGVISNIRIILSDRSRIAANGAKRSNGDLDLRKAVYSPCNLCPEDPTRPPLWQIKAVKVYHDGSRRMVEYTDAWLEIAGYPVFYTPYLTHPDPTVKRESGFLVPDFGTQSDLGVFLKTPYFVNIDDHSDATLTPVYYESSGPAFEAEYPRRLYKGTFDVESSVVEDDAEGIRGHLRGEGEFLIDDTWRWGAETDLVTDDTYLRRYGFSQPNSALTNTLFAEGFRQRNYARVEAMHFRGLQRQDDSETTPIALPIAEFQHVSRPDRYGGQFQLDAGLASLTRDSGADSHRLSVHPGWRNTYAAPSGEFYTLSLGARGDMYYVSDHNPVGPESSFDGVTGRVFPQAKLDWRYPLVRDHQTVHQIVEPMASLVVAPNGSNPEDIPNEDSLEFEFDETSLFQSNRFAGNDRVESGSRIDYGLHWGLYGNGGGYTSVMVGQSARLREDSEFATGSGLENKLSDYVAKVEIHPSSYFDVLYRTRIDREDGNIERNEIAFQAGVPLLRVSTGYTQIDTREGSEFGGREDITTRVYSQMTNRWRSQFFSQHDFAEGQTRRLGMELIYEDECLVFSSSFTRSFFRDRDLRPNDTLLFQITLKTLGEFQTSGF